MIFRTAYPSDAPALAQLGRDSFCAAFAHLYRPEDLDTLLQSAYSESAVAAEIADPHIIHRIAVDEPDSALSAYCKLRHPSWYAERSDARNPIALGQLYCDPARTGEGIGAALMEWAMDEARARGCDAMQLSVWSENTRAQAFYKRYGFEKIADIDFWVGAHRDEEFLLEVRL